MLSAVPGTLAVLLQIQLAQQMGLDHLYLGYWIADCQKMSYKTKYQPLEAACSKIPGDFRLERVAALKSHLLNR